MNFATIDCKRDIRVYFICTLFAWLISHQPAVQNKPATSNQPTVLFSQNKSAPAVSHQPTEQASELELHVCTLLVFWFLALSKYLELAHKHTNIMNFVISVSKLLIV
jgi:hypothetical protein